MSWLDRRISARGGGVVAAIMLGGAGWMLGEHVGMALWEAVIFGFLVGGGLFGIADSIVERLK